MNAHEHRRACLSRLLLPRPSRYPQHCRLQASADGGGFDPFYQSVVVSGSKARKRFRQNCELSLRVVHSTYQFVQRRGFLADGQSGDLNKLRRRFADDKSLLDSSSVNYALFTNFLTASFAFSLASPTFACTLPAILSA